MTTRFGTWIDATHWRCQCKGGEDKRSVNNASVEVCDVCLDERPDLDGQPDGSISIDGREFVKILQQRLAADSGPREYSPSETIALYRLTLSLRDREIELLREAVKTLGANCDDECGQPKGTFAGQQFAAIDRELGR